MPNKIKVRLLINTLGGGGAEKVLIDLTRLMDNSKYDISVISVEKGVYALSIPETVKYHAVIKVRNEFLKRLMAKAVYKMPKRLFCTFFMRGRYDIEVAYLEGFPTDALVALRTTAKKLAFIHCDVSVTGLMHRLYNGKIQCLNTYSLFDRVCFVSSGAKRGFETSVGKLSNACIIHNILDTSRILQLAALPCNHSYKTKGLKIISIGRLTASKSYGRLLNIAKNIGLRYEYEIWIVGDGEEREALRARIRAENIANIQLIGFQSNPYQLMKKADLLVCSSIFEGYSTVVTEAMVLGLPVLTTKCAGMEEILDNGRYGMIVDNDESKLQEGLEQILENPAVYESLKRAAKERSCMITGQNAVQEYESLFKEVCK